MNANIEEILARMRALEEELQAEFAKKREEFGFLVENKRVRFAREVLEKQRLARLGLWRFLRHSRISVALTAPLIYAGFIPFLLMDLFVTVYQRICFPIYGIPRARRSDYMAFDRGDLPYLNAIERFNCFYCSYGNGVAAYLREVAARTEQYWCPIKHARRIVATHERYPRFFEFGDAEAYRKGLERIRASVGEGQTGDAAGATSAKS
ncbi:hypothetical protein [Dokdonella immobilis]|uniref:Uncharacterized protein n=1 Tax=Dokdonella immobilis TaxID=578942 RepID=A0A1I4V976_9GAMM|nr:hypothetical protein [Dokdonella immobilis]SFM97724.1 hypothetical protein SAMN05216289_101233 [Dokdonella immobilis]